MNTTEVSTEDATTGSAGIFITNVTVSSEESGREINVHAFNFFLCQSPLHLTGNDVTISAF